eukprot:14460179-Alexandrium_andersonii.AAC.1
MGPPEISPTQPSSPGRGLLSPGRMRATGGGRAAPLPARAALRTSSAIAVGAQPPQGPLTEAGGV